MTKLEKKETYEATLQLYTRYINTVAGKISFDYYEDLKQFFQKIIEKQNEKIVLKKV